VFGLVLVGLLGGLATLAVARSPGTGRARPGLALAGVVGCLACTLYYLAEYPAYDRPGSAGGRRACPGDGGGPGHGPGRLPLAGPAPAALAVVLVAGFVLAARQELGRAELDIGMMGYLFAALPVVLLAGSVAAALAGRSFRAGLWAGAWAVVLALPLLVGAWLAEALGWWQQRGQLLLDGEGGPGLGASLVGVNLGDAVWWTLVALVLWALPFGVLGAAAGSARPRRRRLAG
jgi:hypothetical protein